MSGAWGTRVRLTLALTVLALQSSSYPVLAEAAPTPEQVDQGREIYEENCQTCHGRDMVSSGTVTFDLRKFPKDDANRFRSSVLNGKGTAMPAFQGRLSDEDVSLLWAYVRGGP
jgi:mono/diheme cytochrome c family protein